MGTIRVEFVPVQKFALGLFFFDHLQIVFQDETDPIDSQDYWYVLEGVIDGGAVGGALGANGDDGRTSLSVSNGASREALVDKIGTPEQRGSRIVATGPDALLKWDQVVGYGRAIGDQQLPYVAFAQPFSSSPTINSTSFVASALYSIGIDVNLLMPFGVGLSPGGSTLIGTAEADTLQTTDSFTTLVGGAGDDVLMGRTTSFFPEKFFGGEGDDTFVWSFGQNIIDGGQPRLSTANDGIDTVDYAGVGQVAISVDRFAVEGKIASYKATFAGGSDKLFSIEQVSWDKDNDVLIAVEGVGFLEKPLLLDFKGESGGNGDRLGLMGGSDALIINAVNDTTTSVQLVANEGLDAGYWAKSAEWLIGSGGDDRIYSGPATYGVEGGAGHDVIDARLAAAFTGISPEGYDVEISGGDGDDQIVSSGGRTLARGGAGADTFVLSTISSIEDFTVELVILDADVNDRLYVPFDFFRLERGDYDGSNLFQLAGAPFDFNEFISESFFFGAPAGSVPLEDDFIGVVSYLMEGDDLIVLILQARLEEQTDPGSGLTELVLIGESRSTTIVRVVDWSEGELGITFPLEFDPDVASQIENFDDYPGLRQELLRALAPERFMDPLEARPAPHIPLEIASAINPQPETSLRLAASEAIQTEGGDDDDVLMADDGGPYRFFGRGGDDRIVGSAGGDILDGGSGADSLEGGRGNDLYFVDNAGDAVVELDRGGFDRVVSAIDYALPDYVEHLALTGAALAGSGNALRNTLEGNEFANALSGGEGDDVLAGNAGDDVLSGGPGGDGYVYELGDGRDIIAEDDNADPADEDVLLLTGGIVASDVSLHRNPSSPSDLILRVGTDGGRIVIRDYFAGARIEKVVFDDGETWGDAQLRQRADAAVTSSNSAPVARDDAFAIRQQTSFLIPLAALIDNDADEDGDILHLASVTAVSGGGAVVDAGGVRVNPSAGAAQMIVDYAVSDGRGGTAAARLTLTLMPNAPPVIDRTEFAPVIEDQAAAGRLVAADADGDPLAYTIKPGHGPSKGAVTLLDDGRFIFTPAADANGSDSFTLTASDGVAAPVEHVFNFNIAPVNDAPVAVADAGFSVAAGGALTIASQALRQNDRDIDGDALQIRSVAAGPGLTVAINAAGDVVVTAAAGPAGQRSFTYEITDGAGGVSSAAVLVDVTAAPAPTNAAPVIARAELAPTREDRPASGRLIATDADGDALTFAIAAGHGPRKGVVSLSGDGSFVYTPKRDANGGESFVLTVTDGKGAPVAHEFSFTIQPDYDLRDIFHYDLLSHGGVLGALQAAAEFARLARNDDWDGSYWRGVITKYGDAIEL